MTKLVSKTDHSKVWNLKHCRMIWDLVRLFIAVDQANKNNQVLMRLNLALNHYHLIRSEQRPGFIIAWIGFINMLAIK